MMRTVRGSGRLGGGGLPEGGVCLEGGDICLGEGGCIPPGHRGRHPSPPPRPRGRHPQTQRQTHPSMDRILDTRL